MPAVAYEPRPSNGGLRSTTFLHTTPAVSPLEVASLKKVSRLPPRHRNSSADLTSPPTSTSSTCSTAPSSSSSTSSSSSVAGISIMKPVKAPSKQSSYQRRKASMDFMLDTPFEAHLEDIYAGRVDVDDGLAFFESHGYYDVSEANTVAMFRQNFGMKKQFWDGTDQELVFYEEMNLDTVDLAGLQVLSVGALLSKNVTRRRTVSGRFQLLDDQGNEVDAEAHYEAEKEKRMKLKHMEVDEDDLADLAEEQIVLAKAITVIRTEKTRFRKYFYQACTDEMSKTTPQQQAVVASPSPSLSIQLPPYSGYLYVLKDTIPHLFRSWHKRWFYLDFNSGLAQMYKRSYWKSPRGVLDMRSVMSITRMNQSDICIQCFDGRSMLLRSKVGTTDADLWMNLLQFARRQMGTVAASPNVVPQLLPSTSTETTMTKVTTTTTLSFSGASSGNNSLLVSTKLRAQNERSVLDVMAVLMQNKATTASPNSITAA